MDSLFEYFRQTYGITSDELAAAIGLSTANRLEVLLAVAQARRPVQPVQVSDDVRKVVQELADLSLRHGAVFELAIFKMPDDSSYECGTWGEHRPGALTLRFPIDFTAEGVV